jgi:hypothetical protein
MQLYTPPESERLVETINTQWTFNYFPEAEAEHGDYENPAFDDSQWSAIAVPHTWQTYETTRELHPYIRNASATADDPYWWNGWGWYRKRIVIGKELEGKKVAFEFDGVQKYAKVYLNGVYLGDHKGGYTAFYMDATDAVRFGEENILVLAVHNAINDRYRIAPMNAGNWVSYGGITRDVRIVVTDRLNVPYQGTYNHEGGMFITTPEVSAEEAIINVKSYVQNLHQRSKNARIVTVITDSEGKVIERMESRRRIRPGEIVEFDQTTKPVRNPNLWHVRAPYIYNAYVEVYDGNRLADVFHSPFGIRSIDWDFDQRRLILNGQITQLHGTNRHEEYIWLGQAFPKWIEERDLLDIANGLEMNFMRAAHYPNAQSVYHFMDNHGIAITMEVPNIKNQDFCPIVQEQNLRAMIRRHRNHPSVMMWSMGNETDRPVDGRIAWEEDQTRILTVRQPYSDLYNPEYVRHTDEQLPLESFLRCTIRGWYDRDDGLTPTNRNVEPEDLQWTGTEHWQYLRSIAGDWIDDQPGGVSGQKMIISEFNGAVWLYADHGADREYVNAPVKHVNPKGWVDSWRTPKYVYYLWQANFAKTPMIHIQPHFWRSDFLGQRRTFYVTSNCEEVELFVNGVSKGKQRPTKEENFSLRFTDILVEEGTIEVVGMNNGVRVTNNKVVMAGEPARVTIEPVHPHTMMASLDNIGEFKVSIVDQHGVHIYGANNTLRFQVEGPATLVGTNIYISDRDKYEEYEGTMYIDVPVTVLIRATGKPGNVTVTATAVGLTPASATVEVLPYVYTIVPGIEQPKLNPEDRKPVQINTLQANIIRAPMEMNNYRGEVSFPIARQNDYAELMQEFILKENPTLDTSTVDFKYLIESFVAILNSTTRFTGYRGYVVADDYNFIANQYNISRAITRNIALKNLPAAYKEFLKDYYAKAIIGQGVSKNHLAENELIDNLPQGGGIVVFTGNEFADESVKRIEETDVAKILDEVYPEARSWSNDERTRALRLIARINPMVTHQSVRDRSTRTRTSVYIAEPNNIVFIPTMDELKNHSFPNREI